jgi:hypothetical protein
MTELLYYAGFLWFICERESIRLAKQRNEPWPWTTNEILQQWSFTNIHREHDRVTVWIKNRWRKPNADDPDLAFAMAVARFVNWPDTLAELGYPVPWDRKHFIAVIMERMARGVKCWGPAYNISNGGSTAPKHEHIAGVLGGLWQARTALHPKRGELLGEYHTRLLRFDGLGSFMGAQIVADMRYVEPLHSADDWWEFAASGPGSRRGLARVLGRNPEYSWTETEWRRAHHRLHEDITPELDKVDIHLHAQDLQNCECEWDKNERVRLGEGTPKRRYRRPE